MAKLLSLLGHPLLVLTLGLTLLMATNPFAFGVHDFGDPKARLLLLTVFITTFVLPGVGVAVMKPLGLIQSLEMRDRQERTGPYILTGVFYLWVFKSLLSDIQVPPLFAVFALGTTIGLFVAFFANIFTKISAHALGMGGLVAMAGLMCFRWAGTSLSIPLGQSTLLISTVALLVLVVLFAGAVGWARLRLDAHEPVDVYRGYAAGFASVMVAQSLL